MSLPSPSSPSLFERVHERLDAARPRWPLQADCPGAAARGAWHRALLRRIAIENAANAPCLGGTLGGTGVFARARTHCPADREYLAKVQAPRGQPPRERARRQAVLTLHSAAPPVLNTTSARTWPWHRVATGAAASRLAACRGTARYAQSCPPPTAPETLMDIALIYARAASGTIVPRYHALALPDLAHRPAQGAPVLMDAKPGTRCRTLSPCLACSIVVTRRSAIEADGSERAASLAQALELAASSQPAVWVIGGTQITPGRWPRHSA